MEKWEQLLKNDVNRPLPNIIDKTVEDTLKQLPRKRPKRKIYYGLAAAIAFLSLTFGFSLISPAFANTIKDIPVIGSAFEFVGNIGVKKGKEESLTTELGEQVEVDGQLITFTETLYDGGEIHIGYIREVNKSNKSSHFMDNLILQIDSKPIGSYGMGGNESEIEKGLYAGTFSVRVREEIPESFVLSLRSREGKSWSVELPVEKKGNHQSFLVNKMENRKDLTILYDKITFLPTSTEISLRLLMDEKAFTANKYMMLDYQVIDDQGRVLQPFSGGGGGGGPTNGKVLHKFEQYYEPFKIIPNSLTIKPYLTDIDETPPKIERIKWAGEKTTLSQGKIGHLTILDSKAENGVTTFTYKVEGDDLYSQANALWLEDSAGNRYDSDQPAVRVDGSINQYQTSFSATPPSNDLYIVTVSMTPPNFLEELEVTIDLKE
ncbi:hypothetical protein AM500_19505 [Bacillus sp. FJAT-18017]|uniref:DUF4179 domain-containing protein n=1 Tax=Bacillus sp. FJAT-18017 TaxID=1705566 RepID=UPI0006AFB3F4|nr:DUF4179 domain-containing protein [Bacillus sp. FJAT-18017]ALC91723.1 hypothetical protein AM500_19505 [Bacillus sp. FJAT-18017]